MAAPLATAVDLQTRLGRTLTASEVTQVDAFLRDASAKVRAYTRQDFDLVTDDEVVLRPVGTRLRLPQRPVVGVTTVAAVAPPGATDYPLVGWSWDGADLVLLDGWDDIVINAPSWLCDGGTAPSYRVTYDHGYDPVPEDVVAVVAGMVLRILTTPSPVEGMVTERIGQYSYGLQQGAGANGLTTRLTADDKASLDRYRRTASTIQVRLT